MILKTKFHEIGNNRPVYIIAEVAQAHDGSLGMAHSFIDMVAKQGASAVKFQTHIAKSESCKYEPWRVKFSKQDETRFDYWKRMEFTQEQWVGIKNHAEDLGLDFISTPLSIDAITLLNEIGVSIWKIASGDSSNTELITEILRTQKPAIFSSGLSDWNEMDKLVATIKKGMLPFALLQCTSSYPTSPEQIGLNNVKEISSRYTIPTGLSDHSGEIFPAIAAVAHGASIVEVHVTFSKYAFGPDTRSSLDPSQLKTMIEGVRFTERMLNNPVNKSELDEEQLRLKRIFGRSLVAKAYLKKGTVINEELIAYKKPGGGIQYKETQNIVGKTLVKDLKEDEQIQLEHLR